MVLVHMLEEGDELPYVKDDGVARIADPRCNLYRAFELGKGSFWDLFGPKVLFHGAIAFFRGCGVGMIRGDGLQMPGAFLVKDGIIVMVDIVFVVAIADCVMLSEKNTRRKYVQLLLY